MLPVFLAWPAHLTDDSLLVTAGQVLGKQILQVFGAWPDRLAGDSLQVTARQVWGGRHSRSSSPGLPI